MKYLNILFFDKKILCFILALLRVDNDINMEESQKDKNYYYIKNTSVNEIYFEFNIEDFLEMCFIEINEKNIDLLNSTFKNFIRSKMVIEYTNKNTIEYINFINELCFEKDKVLVNINRKYISNILNKKNS